MSQVLGADYLFFVDAPPADLGDRVEALMAATELPVQRRKKAKKRRRHGPSTGPSTSGRTSSTSPSPTLSAPIRSVRARPSSTSAS